MDNEMKAKVEEYLKTRGRQKLSMDEAERVAGGVNFYGTEMSDQQFRDTLFTLADYFGFALAVEIFQEVTHADLEVYLNTTKWPTSWSDRERMAIVLDKFYKK